MLLSKLEDRKIGRDRFRDDLDERITALAEEATHRHAYRQEMERFLPKTDLRESISQADFWEHLILTLRDQADAFRDLQACSA